MTAYTYRDILMAELLNRKNLNPSFSLRAFARILDLSPGHLSMVLRGKKALTPDLATQILSKIELSPRDRTSFLSTAFPKILQVEDKQESLKRILKEDEFNLISEWYHFAILSLGALPANRADSHWIAARLGIEEMRARDAFNRLKRLGLVDVRTDGSFVQTGKKLTTGDDAPSDAIKRSHKQVLDMAKLKLDSVPVADREYGSMTMAINPAKLKKVKKMIRDFQDQICAELEVGKRKSVYILSMQLFPVSQDLGDSK